MWPGKQAGNASCTQPVAGPSGGHRESRCHSAANVPPIYRTVFGESSDGHPHAANVRPAVTFTYALSYSPRDEHHHRL